jgi:Lipopolysaccharide-assembly
LKNNLIKPTIIFVFGLLMMIFGQSCHYSLSGIATTATSVSVDQFFNNSDLAPANMGVTFTNSLKDYFQQNSNLKVMGENGELMIEGVISEYRLNPVAPTANTSTTNTNSRLSAAALTRLTIAVKVNFTDSKEPKNSFKDKSFSFFQDFDSNLNYQTVQEDLEKKIFDQIMLDIFNATVANW